MLNASFSHNHLKTLTSSHLSLHLYTTNMISSQQSPTTNLIAVVVGISGVNVDHVFDAFLDAVCDATDAVCDATDHVYDINVGGRTSRRQNQNKSQGIHLLFETKLTNYEIIKIVSKVKNCCALLNWTPRFYTIEKVDQEKFIIPINLRMNDKINKMMAVKSSSGVNFSGGNAVHGDLLRERQWPQVNDMSIERFMG